MSRRPSAAVERSVGQGLSAVLTTDDGPWYRKPHLLKLNLIIFSLILFSSANGYDGSMMNGVQALLKWHEFMDYPKGSYLGLINAIGPLASLFIVLPAALLVQRYGRKPGVWLGYAFLVLGAVLQTWAPNPAAFIVARGIVGFAGLCFGISTPLLITEIAFPTHRAICTALYNCGWYVGSLTAAWATFGTRNFANDWSWKIPSILQLAIPIVCLPGFLLAPESPRYLVSMDRIEEARKVLTDYHGGGVHNALIDFELDEISTTLRMEKEAKESTSYMDMLKTKGNRHRLFISITLGVFAQWNGVGVVSYYFVLVLQTAGITDVTDQTLLNGCIQIWNLIAAVCGAFGVDRFGRRKLFMASTIGMLISYVCITGLSGSFAQTGTKSVGVAVIPFLFLYYGCYDIAFTPLLVSYPAEIWPYNLRARGLAVTFFSTQAAVGFNIFVNPIALEAIGWKYYIVFVAILVVIAITCWFCYPETKGHTLEEMAVVFDGDDAAAPAEMDVLARVAQNKATGSQVIFVENKYENTTPPAHQALK